MQNAAEQDAAFKSIRAEVSKQISDLADSGRKDPETRSLVYALKRFLEKLDSLEEELMYVPLAKYVDIKNRFPGSPRN